MKWLLRTKLLFLRDALDKIFHFEERAIFCYHSISSAHTPTTIAPEVFERQLGALKSAGYSFVSLEQVVGWARGESGLPAKCVALTFDDGYADFLTAALPILEREHAPAGLFLVGDSEKSRGALANSLPLLDEAGIERLRNHPLVTLGYHSLTHPNLSTLDPEGLQTEMTPPFKTEYFAYPGGNYSPAAITLARDMGYRGAFSIKRHLLTQKGSPHLIPRSVITSDMQVNTVRFHATRALEWYRELGQLR